MPFVNISTLLKQNHPKESTQQPLLQGQEFYSVQLKVKSKALYTCMYLLSAMKHETDMGNEQDIIWGRIDTVISTIIGHGHGMIQQLIVIHILEMITSIYIVEMR